MWSGLYNALLVVAAVFAVPFYGAKMLLTGKYRKSFGPKLGLLDREAASRMAGMPRIWVHAVSVGEVTAAAPIVAALRSRFSGACIILSTSTETGQEMARKLVPAASAHIYYPLDIPRAVHKVIDWVNPDIFIPVETELWPNFIRICRERGTRIVMANGRLSPRSFRRYHGTRFFWKEVLASLDAAGVISATDAERLAAIGMPAERIHILGNAKFDGLAARVSPELEQEIAACLRIAPGEAVLVAGSTHEGEEERVLDAFAQVRAQLADALLLLVPRHPERFARVAALCEKRGLSLVLRSSHLPCRPDSAVFLGDSMGELPLFYAAADLAFIGGSLVPTGGHNPLEAAALGVPLLFGPHMFNFAEISRLLLREKAALQVRDATGLADSVVLLLRDAEQCHALSENGRRVVEANRGALERLMKIVSASLGDTA